MIVRKGVDVYLLSFLYLTLHGGQFEVRHPRCVEPKLQNGKSTVNYIY